MMLVSGARSLVIRQSLHNGRQTFPDLLSNKLLCLSLKTRVCDLVLNFFNNLLLHLVLTGRGRSGGLGHGGKLGAGATARAVMLGRRGGGR